MRHVAALLLLPVCWSHEIVGGSNNGIAQIAHYEGKRTTCWLDSLERLKVGCDGESVLSEADRKAVALAFTNCQFEEDGLPARASSAEMAAEAQAGNTFAYSIFTYHLLSVEVICLHLSQRLFQKASLMASEALSRASHRSAEQLSTLSTSMSQVKNEAGALRNSLAEHSHEVNVNFKKSHQHAMEMNERIEAHRAVIERGLGSIEDQIEGNKYRLNRLTDQTDGITSQLSQVEMSAISLAATQESVFSVVHNVESIVKYLLGSVFSLESFAYFAASLTFIYLVTTPVQARSARLTLLLLSLANFLVERLLDRTTLYIEEGERHASVWMVRRVFGGIQIFTLLVVWYRWRDPQAAIQGQLFELNTKVDRLLGGRSSLGRAEMKAIGRDVARLKGALPASWAPCGGGYRRSPSVVESVKTEVEDEDTSTTSTSTTSTSSTSSRSELSPYRSEASVSPSRSYTQSRSPSPTYHSIPSRSVSRRAPSVSCEPSESSVE